MRVSQFFSYENLPDAVKEIEEPPYSKYDMYGYIVIWWDDETIEVFNDHMEPEDAAFHRDLKWIKGALNKAYNEGKVLGMTGFNLNA